MIGFEGIVDGGMAYAEFKALVADRVGAKLLCMDFGPSQINRVGVVSGGAAEEVEEAGRKGIDVYVSGEPKLVAYSLAQEYGVNAVFAGHYATEVFGVQALGDVVRDKFGVESKFLDLKVPF